MSKNECYEEFVKWWGDRKPLLSPPTTSQDWEAMAFGNTAPSEAWKGWCAAWNLKENQPNKSEVKDVEQD